MENLRIFDTFEDYIDYKESPEFEMPSANAVHNTQYGYDLMFINNGINHNIISYVMHPESTTDEIFSNAQSIGNENILLKADYKGIKYLVLDSPLHKFISSIDDTFLGSDIMSIVLPDTIKEIYEYAFADCANLQQIILPKYLEKIRTGSFSSCAELQEIIIPEYVNLIEEYSFYECDIQTLEFKSKHLENLTIEGYGFCLAQYLKTIISRSKLPFNMASMYSFYECGTGNISDRRFYLPFNFDEGAYNIGLFGNNNSPFKHYKVSHKISNLSGNITCNIGSAPLNTIASNIGAISHNSTMIQVPVIYGGASFYDVLGEEFITTTKSGILNVPITANTTFETKNHTVTFCRNILNVDTGQDLIISGSASIPQWGKPRYRIEYTDDSTGWYDLGNKQIRTSNTITTSTLCRVFRNRNSNMHSTSSKMRIYFKNILNPKFYVTNYAQSTYDYIQVSALDKTISEQISFTLSGKQNINYVNNFTTASFNVNDDEEHFVEVAFRKDTSTDRNYDAGYVNFKINEISDKTFQVNENHRLIGSYSIEHNNFRNPLYNGNANNTGAYRHGLQSGTTSVGNTPLYLYNVYNLVLDKISGEYSSKNGTNANYLLTYHVIDAKSGLYTTPDKLYIPYHKSGTTASTQTTFIDTNSAIRVRGFYDNNSMYFDVKQNGFDVKNRITIGATWNAAATDFPAWYLAINDYATVTNAHGIHTVNINPYTTATYAVPYTPANGSTTTYTYAKYAWTQCATTATNIAPQEVIPDVNFGKLYMSGNAGKNSSVSLMTIDVTGYKKFTMYARSSGESNYDYIVISKPNVTIDNFMKDVCFSQRSSSTPTNFTYLSLKGKATSTSITKSLYSASAFIKVEFNLKDYIYTTPTCQIICAFVKDSSQNQQHDAGFIYIPN